MFSFAKKEKKKHPVNISKDNSKWEKQIILSMILNKEGLHCLVAKKLSSLLKGTTHNGVFYFLNFPHQLKIKYT